LERLDEHISGIVTTVRPVLLCCVMLHRKLPVFDSSAVFARPLVQVACKKHAGTMHCHVS
jgi:hypothetical protein